jgi:hypothetical protein
MTTTFALAAEPELAPLSPGREALRVALAEVRAAQQTFAEADRPVQALNGVAARAVEAETALAALQAERQQRVGDWLIGGALGERPAASHDEVKAERAAKTARTDADAAEKALPAVLAPRNAVLASLTAAAFQRDAGLVAATLDAAREVVEAELKPKIEAMLRVEARLLGLRHALFMRANAASGAIPAAGGAAGDVLDMIRAAKAEVGVERADKAGEEFLNRLGADPTAKL